MKIVVLRGTDVIVGRTDDTVELVRIVSQSNFLIECLDESEQIYIDDLRCRAVQILVVF